jgi:hypothetical protein
MTDVKRTRLQQETNAKCSAFLENETVSAFDHSSTISTTDAISVDW